MLLPADEADDSRDTELLRELLRELVLVLADSLELLVVPELEAVLRELLLEDSVVAVEVVLPPVLPVVLRRDCAERSAELARSAKVAASAMADLNKFLIMCQYFRVIYTSSTSRREP